jgi:hypothetical protein
VVLNAPEGTGLVDVGKNSSLYGLICSLRGDIRINTGAELMGTVYGANNVQLNGNVHGQVLCTSFKEQNAGGMYLNHILNGGIDRNELSSCFVFAPVFDNRPQEIIKWLE